MLSNIEWGKAGVCGPATYDSDCSYYEAKDVQSIVIQIQAPFMQSVYLNFKKVPNNRATFELLSISIPCNVDIREQENV